MNSNPTPVFSSLDDFIFSIGEKAFLAWIRFQNWEEKQAVEENSFLLPFSLNQVIQRLRIGKATFYDKVLTPLLDAGLVTVLPAPDKAKELRLLVHRLPNPIIPNSTKLDEPSITRITPPPIDSFAKSTDPSTDLPIELQTLFQQESIFPELKEGIIDAYHQRRDHPDFTIEKFVQEVYTRLKNTAG